MNYADMNLADMTELAEKIAAASHGDTELCAFLARMGEIAAEHNPALATLLAVLADEPEEVASFSAERIAGLATLLHPDTDGPAICRAAAKVMDATQRAYESGALVP